MKRTGLFLLLAAAFLLAFTLVGQTPPASADPGTNDDNSPTAVENTLLIEKLATNAVIRRGETAEFTIVVVNAGPSALVNVSVSDPEVPDCNRSLGNLERNGERVIICSKLNVQQAFTNVATVTGQNVNNAKTETASDSARIDVIDLDVSLLAAPDTLPEPGGTVQFDVSVTNSGSLDLTLSSLDSPQYGDLLDVRNSQVQNNTCTRADDDLPLLDSNGGTFTCAFEADVQSQPPEFRTVTTAVASDTNNNTTSDSAEAVITITDQPAELDLTLTANPATIAAPGGTATLEVLIENKSTVDVVNVLTLTDSVLGNVDGRGSCNVPQTIQPGANYTCSYSYELAGPAGSTRQHTLALAAQDDDNPPNSIALSDSTIIDIIEPPSYVTWLPLLADASPNNRCNSAYQIELNRSYFYFPTQVEGWYYFELDRETSANVEINNFIPREGQGIVYPGEDCGSLKNAIANAGGSNLNRVIRLGTQPAGRYYLLIQNDGPLTNAQPYELFVRTQ